MVTLAAAVSLAGCGKEPAAPPAAPAASPPAPAAEMPAGHAHPMPARPDVDVDLSGVTKAEGGVTIAELYADKDTLAGQVVTVRGVVVKVNPDIMGTNWLHIRDGSGSEGSNDLTITSGALPEIGETVLVRGVVQVNKDFGMGYQYSLIIEDAEVEVESAGAY
jgi:hypothetical protein